MGMESIYKLSVVLDMVDRLTSPLMTATDQTSKKLHDMQQSFGLASLAGTAMTTAGLSITKGLLGVAASTFDTQDALAELKSLGVVDLAAVESAAKSFSDTWAGTSKSDFISAAYDIKSGIASLSDEGVAQFTELSGLTAKATKSTIGEMTSLFATGYGIYKDYYSDLSDMEFGEIFSAGISTAVKNYKTSGSQMAQSISTLGATATSAKVPLEEQLAILGMMQATMSGSEAATKYKALLNTAVSAGDKLGLSFTDANNQLRSMPEILGILHTKYGDTIDAMEKKEIKEAFGSDEAVAVIDLLYNKTGDLQTGILDLYDAMGSGTEVATEMATAINSTESQRFIVLKQQMHNVTEELGGNLLPTVNKWISSGTNAISKASEWIQNHQKLAGTIMTLLLYFGIFLTVAGGLTSAFGVVGSSIVRLISVGRALGSAFETLQIYGMYAGDAIKLLGSGVISFVRQGITAAATALPGLIGSVWSFTAALLANPVTWIVVGMIALGVAVALLAKNWDAVSSFIKGKWTSCVNSVKGGLDRLSNSFHSGLDNIRSAAREKMGAVRDVYVWVTQAAESVVKEKLQNIKTAYEQHGGGLPGIAAAAMEGIKGYYSAGFDFINNLTGGRLDGVKELWNQKLQAINNFIGAAGAWFARSGEKIMTTFTEGIKKMADKPVEAVRGALARVRKLLPFSDAKEGPLSTLTLSGRRVFETINTGMKQTADLPSETTKDAFAQVKEENDVSAEGLADVFRNRGRSQKSGGSSTSIGETIRNYFTSSSEKQTVIQKLELSVKLEQIKDLPLLFKLIDELKESANGGKPVVTA